MKKIFFYIDRTNKQIRFIHYPIDRKGNMIGETEQHSSISFDDVLTMTEEMSRSFFSDLQTICGRLQYYLDFGKQKYPACEKEMAEYRSKYENNFLALILINILETEYWAQRDRLLSWDPVIIVTAIFSINIKRAKKVLTKKVQELKAAVDRLELYIERDFKCEIEQTMTAKSEIRATVEDDEDRVYMGLNDSFEPFVYFFSRKIQNSNINLLQPRGMPARQAIGVQPEPARNPQAGRLPQLDRQLQCLCPPAQAKADLNAHRAIRYASL